MSSQLFYEKDKNPTLFLLKIQFDKTLKLCYNQLDGC